MLGGGWRQAGPSCWLIYYPFPPFPHLADCFFFSEHVCCHVMCMRLHIVTQHTQSISHCSYVLCLSLWQANKDPLFLTGVTFPSEYPASPETLVKLTVYDAKDKSQESVSKNSCWVSLCLLCVCMFEIRCVCVLEIMMRLCSKPVTKQSSFKWWLCSTVL